VTFKALTVAFVIAAALAVTNAQEPFAVGIVRIDGHLMPIALITPQLFEESLGARIEVNGVPIEATAIDWPFKGLAWTLSEGRGRKPVDVTTIEPLMVRMPYCSDRLMWRTTLKRPPAPDGVAPIRKIGMAARGAAIEHPDEVTEQPDAASRRVARLIVKLAHEKEASRLKTEPKEYWPQNSYPDRAQAPVRIEMLHRYLAGGVATYYFEATKPWWKGSSENGLVTGWVTDSAGTLRDQDVVYKFNNDSQKENESAIVWGIVRYQERALWLLEWHGWENEYYTLHDWPSGVVRATVNAYEC
jgi:hypothetical protein